MGRISDAVEALADVLRGLGLQVYTEPPGTIDAPAATVLLGPIDYSVTIGRQNDDIPVMIDLFMTMGPQGMENLYEYLDSDGERSIVSAIDADPTLGGTVEFAVASGTEKPDRVGVEGQADFYHATILVDVSLRDS